MSKPKNPRALQQAYAHVLPLCEGIATWLHPHVEVVLHDIESDRIVGIWNGFSRRRRGSASLIAREIRLSKASSIYGPYEKANVDGRRLKSISCVVRTGQGGRSGLLCLNLDVSSFDALRGFLDAFTTMGREMPDALIKRDWREQIHQSLGDFLRKKGVGVTGLNTTQRTEFIRLLDSSRLFATRHAARHVGELLGISRASVYNCLARARKGLP